MNKQTLLQSWDQIRQGNGIVLRCIAALPEDKLDSHPIQNMRTPKELVVHLYNDVLKVMTEGIPRGSVNDYDLSRKVEMQLAAGLTTRAALLQFARDCWNAADRAVRSMTDAQLTAQIQTPFGMNPPGFVLMEITRDEFNHHRGQLWAYARALGVEPPSIYDFANNEPQFQPKVEVKA
jgi:uncharacterized damage-inducible protein DinB